MTDVADCQPVNAAPLRSNDPLEIRLLHPGR